MNKVFNILWFEDDTDWIRGIEDQIKEILADKFLEANILKFRKADTFKIDDNNVEKNFDLILVDNCLLHDTKGSELISKIRTNKILTDILFYSSNYEKLIEFLKSQFSEDLNGVYITKRDNEKFLEKVTKLIEKNIRRSENINNFRGIVTESTCEFEEIVQNKLNKLFTYVSQENQKKLNDIVTKNIFPNYITKLNQQLKEFEDGTISFIEYNNLEQGFSMAHRLSIIREFSKEIDKPIKIDKKNIGNFYTDLIGTYRNKLNHKTVGDTISINGEDIKIDENFYQKLRKNIKIVDNKLGPTLDSFINSVREDK